MTHSPTHIDRHRTQVGARRKVMERTCRWFRRWHALCTTDAMKVRLGEELIKRLDEIERAG